MDVITYIKDQLGTAHNELDTALKDTTPDQFNWSPPGTISPISAVLVHTLAGEDLFIQELIRGKPQLWNAGEWARRIGVPAAPGGPERNVWDEYRKLKVPMEPVMEYKQELFAATDAWLASLPPEELDRPVNFFGRIHPVGGILMITVTHLCCHAGEIAALKGMQGVKGLPY
jgi:hypothetical protein